MERSSNETGATSDGIKMIGDLSKEIDLKIKSLDKIQVKYKKKILDHIKMLEQNDELRHSLSEETRKLQLVAKEHIEALLDEQKLLKLELELKNSSSTESESEKNKHVPKKARKLDGTEHMMHDDNSEIQKELEDIKEQLQEKVDYIDTLEDLNSQLLIKERETNEELQKARKTLIVGLTDVLGFNRTNIGIKRLGEIDIKPFKDACKSKFPSHVADIEAAELISAWQLQIEDPHWHPFVVVQEKTGERKTEIEKDDKLLRELHKQWGDEVYRSVTTALLELEQYNPSGRHVLLELWNFKENKKAALREVILYIVALLKTLKRKRN